jgi:hypothetical protein
MRILRVAFVALSCLSLGGCLSTQTLGTVAGAGIGAAAGSYLFRPEPRPRTRTVVIERPVYVRPAYPGPHFARPYSPRYGY